MSAQRGSDRAPRSRPSAVRWVALATTLAVAACDVVRSEPVGTSPDTTGSGKAFEVSTETFAFSHTVGRTPCPQPLGELRIINRSDGPLLVHIETRPPLALLDLSTSAPATGLQQKLDVTVRAMAETVQIYFDRSTQDPVLRESVTLTAGGQTTTVRVSGNVGP